MAAEVDRRKKDKNWYVADEWGSAYDEMQDGCMLAVLMDLRDEMKQQNMHLMALRSALARQPLLEMQAVLRRISANTYKPKKRKKTVL